MEPPTGEKDAFSQFPAPPGFYRLYAAGPGAGPPPPPPVKGSLHVLGEPFDTDEAYYAPLDMPKLFAVQPDGSVDIKGELLKLNKGLLFLFRELLVVLVQQPSAYAATLTQVMVALHNMGHLLNMARPLQARQTLKYVLQSQIEEKQQALAALRASTASIRQQVLALTQQLASVGGDDAESLPRQPGGSGEAADGGAGDAGAAAAMEEG